MALCFLVTLLFGRRYVWRVEVPGAKPETTAADFSVSVETDDGLGASDGSDDGTDGSAASDGSGGEILRVMDKSFADGVLSLTLEGVSRGKAFVVVSDAGKDLVAAMFYVHPLHIITAESYLGSSTGDFVLPLATAVFLAVLLFLLIQTYRADVRTNMYQYKNVRNVGLIIYLASLLIGQIFRLIAGGGVLASISSVLQSAGMFSTVALPVAFVVSILVSISNVVLMRREGRNVRNMLGFFLGLLICFGTIFPHILGEWLQRTSLVDVHNERSAALYVELIVEHGIFAMITYLECVLLGTIILALKAARHIPAFDKDYIVILGCQIKKDGTLTNLLKGRADRALAFAKMQKDAAGKDITFVPSGGKGSDEVISEAEAIRNYLLECGVSDERILAETRSKNTYENLRNSMEMIAEAETTSAAPRIAFSTTNYHVFRAGILATEQGIAAEGIGSRTRSYFWINAFIREFIATVYAERKVHIRVLVILLLFVCLMVYMTYLGSVL